MQSLLRDSPMFCWNATFILFLTLLTALAVMPPSSPEFLIVCYLAGLWSACFMYAIFVTGWSPSDIAARQGQTSFLSDMSQINCERNRHRLALAIQLTIEEFMKEEFMKEAA